MTKSSLYCFRILKVSLVYKFKKLFAMTLALPSGRRPGQLLPLPPCYATDYLLQDFGAPPPLQTPHYLTILMTERGRHYFFLKDFGAPNAPFPQRHNIYNYLNDGERGAIIFYRILVPRAPPPSPNATILNNLNDREGAPLLFFRILTPPMPPLPRSHNISLASPPGGDRAQLSPLPPPPLLRH